jgi:hypothetical protein
MAHGIYDLRKTQIGLEATPGTLVAATQQLVGEAVYTPQIERVFDSKRPSGVRATPDSDGGIITRKGSRLALSQDLSYEEILYPLLCGVNNDAAPTGSGPYVWTMEPVLSGVATPKTATIEVVIDDGATQHYEREFGYAVCESFDINLAAGSLAKIDSTWFGRAEQSSTFTAALTPVTGRSPIPSDLFGLYIDSSWANLGTTQISTFIRSLNLHIDQGVRPGHALDARADLDFTHLLHGSFSGTLSATVEHTADAATEIGNWRSGTPVFVQLIATDGTKIVQLDMAAVYTSPPVFSEDEGVELVSFELQLEYDATGGKIFSAVVTNSVATQP